MSTQTNENLDDFDMTMDEAIDSGDPELIEKALAKYGDEQEVDSEVDSEEAGDKPAQEETTEDDGDSSDQEPDRVIKSKNGKHEIPYSILESERKRREEAESLARQQQEEIERLQSQMNENQAALDNVKTRLEDQGMDVDAMLRNPDDISEETWKELEEDYGVLGKAFRKLYENQQVIGEKAAQQQDQSSQDPTNDYTEQQVYQALQQNADLVSWQSADPDRWSEAVRIDNELRNNPQWQSKSLEERFDEVVKQTKRNFGDAPEANPSAQSKAKEIIDKTQQPVPDSLTDIGQSPTKNKSTVEVLDGLDADQIAERMQNMSQAEIDSVLSGGF